MKYSVLADVYEELEKHSGKLKKRDILAELLKRSTAKDLSLLAKIITGSVAALETGVSTNMMIKAIGKASGNPESEVKNMFKGRGDLGLTAEELIKGKKQRALLNKELSVERVYDEIVNLPEISGKGSQESTRKRRLQVLKKDQANEQHKWCRPQKIIRGNRNGGC